VAVKRGKSQARRNGGNGGGLPGWAWMVLGIALTVVVVLAAPKFLKSGNVDFIRPKPNPDAQPAASAADDDDAIVADDGAGTPAGKKPAAAAAKPTQYDFYTLLPGDEVPMSDAELAATERAEAAQKNAATTSAPAPAPAPAGGADTRAASAAVAVAAAAKPATPAAPAAAAAAGNDTAYILQAGAFGASGDAEATKARIALLGLSARVESAHIGDKTVYRVRMGPYGTASELGEAKRKLASSGLPAMAIKAK
jgi:cell division protein FtsN